MWYSNLEKTFILSSAKRLPPRWFLADQTDGSHYCPSPGCKVDVQEVPTVVLEFSLWLLGLYGVWHCHDEAVPFLLVGLDIFCEFHSEASTELHSMMQKSQFHHASENGLIELPENPKTHRSNKGLIKKRKHNRSLKVTVQGLDLLAHPSYIHTYVPKHRKHNLPTWWHNLKLLGLKVNWDVSIALKLALIRVGSDAPMMHPQQQSC
jgi:hypothetical protein